MDNLIFKIGMQRTRFGQFSQGYFVKLRIFEDRLELKYTFRKFTYNFDDIESLELKNLLFFKVLKIRTKEGKKISLSPNLISIFKARKLSRVINKLKQEKDL
jgi:hypothetical protein